MSYIVTMGGKVKHSLNHLPSPQTISHHPRPSPVTPDPLPSPQRKLGSRFHRGIRIPACAGTPGFLRYVMNSEKQPAVYILASRYRGTLYIGVTSALWSRICDHKNAATPGFTSRYGAHLLVWYEHRQTMEAAIPPGEADQGLETGMEDRAHRSNQPPLARPSRRDRLAGNSRRRLTGLSLHSVTPAKAEVPLPAFIAGFQLALE